LSICPVLGASADDAKSTHAPDPSLERPAATEQFTPPMMPGMDTDMNDAGVQHRIWIENLEGVYGTRNGGAWDTQAWLGGDFDKLWIKTEGATLGGKTQGAKVEALWARAILPFWDTQLGTMSSMLNSRVMSENRAAPQRGSKQNMTST
jgi:copper resistance protein B